MPPFVCGFTLIEMLIVIAIIGIITLIVITSQSAFNKSLILANTAYDVALSIRNAETYGLGSRALAAAPSTGYGIDFNRATASSFTLFADTYPGASASSVCHPTSDPSAPDAKPGDCAYESDQNELVSTYTLSNNIFFADFCAESAGAWSCANSHGASLSTADIVFSRPNATPFMSVNGSYSTLFPVTNICLSLTSSVGGARYVSVSSSGEINAAATSCP